MLIEYRVDNFKSLLNVAIRPQDRSLVVGMNNAGKTSLCESLLMFCSSAQMPLADGVRTVVSGGGAGITNIYFDKPTTDFYAAVALPDGSEQLHFGYELSVVSKSSPGNPSRLAVENERLTVSTPSLQDVVLLENRGAGTAKLLDETNQSNGVAQYASISIPPGATTLSKLYDMPMNRRASLFKNYLSSWQYYNLSQNGLRRSDHRPNQRILWHDGMYLASALYMLKTTDERKYRELVRNLQRIEPRVELINFLPTADAVFMFLEDKHRKSLESSAASAGTLRYLALCYILTCQPPDQVRPLVIIEEPENGIYVGLLKSLLELLDGSPNSPQVVFTSHAPYFIDLFDDKLDSVFVLRQGDYHSSAVRPDPDHVRKLLESYPLGEQFYREMLS